jgi:hypothetical protein
MSADVIACFNPLCPSPLGGPLVDPDDFDCWFDNSSTIRGKQRFRTSPKYFYTIGDYESSSFYWKFYRMRLYVRLADVWFRWEKSRRRRHTIWGVAFARVFAFHFIPSLFCRGMDRFESSLSE